MNYNSYLRLMTFALLMFFLFVLNFFTDLDKNVIMSVSIILVFLIIFTYIFKTEGSNILKILIIVFSFIGLPLFMLFYLNIFNSLPMPWGGISVGGFAIIFGILAVVTIIKLNYVEIEYDWIDDK